MEYIETHQQSMPDALYIQFMNHFLNHHRMVQENAVRERREPAWRREGMAIPTWLREGRERPAWPYDLSYRNLCFQASIFGIDTAGLTEEELAHSVNRYSQESRIHAVNRYSQQSRFTTKTNAHRSVCGCGQSATRQEESKAMARKQARKRPSKCTIM